MLRDSLPKLPFLLVESDRILVDTHLLSIVYSWLVKLEYRDAAIGLGCGGTKDVERSHATDAPRLFSIAALPQFIIEWAFSRPANARATAGVLGILRGSTNRTFDVCVMSPTACLPRLRRTSQDRGAHTNHVHHHGNRRICNSLGKHACFFEDALYAEISNLRAAKTINAE